MADNESKNLLAEWLYYGITISRRQLSFENEGRMGELFLASDITKEAEFF